MSPDDASRRNGSDDSSVGNRLDTGGHSPPDFEAARAHLLAELARFVSVLRTDGVSVPASGTLSAAQALSTAGLDSRRHVSAALRASLLSEPTDATAFEEAFPTFWRRLRDGFARAAAAGDIPATTAVTTDPDDSTDPEPARPSGGVPDPDTLADAEAPPTADDPDGGPSVRLETGVRRVSDGRSDSPEESDSRRYGATGKREPVGSAAVGPASDELAAIDRFVDAFSTRPGRRDVRSDRGARIDARAALRESLATGGTPLELPSRAAERSELRCCLLIDISGSVLDTIDRGALLAFADRFLTRSLDARVFFFDTELREVTDAFARADGDPAAALRRAEVEWGGGTRIGHAFETLRRTEPHAVDRRTVVVVVSDGLDVGDPDDLEAGITWLADRADAVVWLNPLAVSPAFEPTSRGMSTVEPYVDALFGFAESADLDEAARQITRRGLYGTVGYEYDTRRPTATDGGSGP